MYRWLSSRQKKRRRKKSDDDSSNRSVDSIPNESSGSVTEIDISNTDGSLVEESFTENEEEDLMEAFDEVDDNPVVKDDKIPVFKFDRNEAIAFGIEDASDDEDIPEQFQLVPKNKIGGAIDLPSMKESVTRKKARSTSSTERQQLEEDSAPEKINRSNIQIFNKLLEVEPNADTDLSLFEDEKYGTVSALLGEGAKSFLGLPLAILQTGHFFGTLAFLLMAFVVYPGFPLTNLPTPIREALQGGLFTIYTINAVLAIFAAFKAEERGQPKSLWAIKTFGVGGLAYDQLTQLPTKDQMSKSLQNALFFMLSIL